jgi:NADH-quinone oxidoreductase subunit G
MSDNDKQPITIVVDGIEVAAPEGQMLVDAAQGGDVEIPVFCYEPKLGDPVGACRMCLVEIEGIPKLQTACSTPVRDGMVVYTQTDRVKEAQNAVVEFLLVNHPLDCPVCDKGGECPLQDIAMGWGPGRSRFTDPKRHFEKPIPLSPLVKIDRERCILCYRCVRFSQEISEDEQLQLLERGAKTLVGTHEERPYVAPFHGNIIELCPVGALTSQAYRFRARPWDIEDAGSVCTLCPSQCNVKFTVRDEKVVRVLARDNEEVDDGWLCDKGRFGYGMFASAERLVAPRVREGGSPREAGWEEALTRAAEGLRATRGKVAAIVGGAASNEEAYLIGRVLRGPLGSDRIASGPALPPATRAALDDPRLGAATRDIDSADAILVVGTDPMNEMPIVELRIRKAVRRGGADLLVATERPTALDGGAAIGSGGCLEARRYPPGEAAAFIDRVSAGISGAEDHSGFAEALRSAERIVVVWGERMLAGGSGPAAAEALLRLAAALGLDGREGSGLLEVPTAANGRGIREAGGVSGLRPGLEAVGDAGEVAGPAEIRDALCSGELEGLILWDVDPARDLGDPDGWAEAISASSFTLSASMFDSPAASAADVSIPTETFAERDGSVTHPDGRLQRVRPSVPHPGEVRPLWQVLAELAARLGDETGAGAAREVFELLAADSPIYAGLDYDRIGAQGVRWQEVNADSYSSPTTGETDADRDAGRTPEGGPPAAPGAPEANEVRLGTYRDLWADESTGHSPYLQFLEPDQTVEVSPGTAEELGLEDGQRVIVTAEGRAVEGTLSLRERVPGGTAFLIEGIATEGGNRLAGARSVRIEPAPEAQEPAPGPSFGVAEREQVSW